MHMPFTHTRSKSPPYRSYAVASWVATEWPVICNSLSSRNLHKSNYAICDPLHRILSTRSSSYLKKVRSILVTHSILFYQFFRMKLLFQDSFPPFLGPPAEFHFRLAGAPTRANDSLPFICTALAADSTGSVHFQLWGAEVDALQPGDILRLTNGWV